MSATHAGLMLATLSPDEAATNSLLMKSPVGRVNFLPLGAVRSAERLGILMVEENGRRVVKKHGLAWTGRRGGGGMSIKLARGRGGRGNLGRALVKCGEDGNAIPRPCLVCRTVPGLDSVLHRLANRAVIQY